MAKSKYQRHRPTIFDIAAAAGVSVATADRALNRRKRIAPETAQRILAVAESLGWRPNMVAQSLSRRSLLDFHILIPNSRNPFLSSFADHVDAAVEEFEPFRVRPLLMKVPPLDPVAWAETLDRLQGHSAGVAMIGLNHPLVRASVDRLIAAGTPVITLVTGVPGANCSGYVGIDNLAAGRTAAVLMGRFAAVRPGPVVVFAGTELYADLIQRERGFRETLAERFPLMTVLRSLWNVEDSDESYATARMLLEDNDELAGIYVAGGGLFGVARALVEAGRSRETVLIGHDLAGAMPDLLRTGVVDAAICQNPGVQLNRAIRLLIRLQGYSETAGLSDHTQVEIFIAENLPVPVQDPQLVPGLI